MSAKLIDQLPGTRVLAVGDVMLDEYVWGEVTRISPEAPVPVVDVRDRTYGPGGAANAAAGVAALDGRPVLAGVVGADPHARILEEVLAAHGVDGSGLVVDEPRMTTTKTRVIAQNQQVVRADVEQRRELDEEVEARVLEWSLARLGDVDSVVVSDYAKGVVTERLALELIAESRQRGIPVVVDPKGADYSKYRGATVLAPNLNEAAGAARVPVQDGVDVAEVAGALLPGLDGCALVLTRGREGMTLFEENGAPVEISTEAHEVYDVTGAGDTVAAVLAIALGRGAGLEEAARLANAAAGLAVSKVGTATVTLEELRATRSDS